MKFKIWKCESKKQKKLLDTYTQYVIVSKVMWHAGDFFFRVNWSNPYRRPLPNNLGCEHNILSILKPHKEDHFSALVVEIVFRFFEAEHPTVFVHVEHLC